MKTFRAARRWRGWSLVWRMRNSNSRPGLLQAAASKVRAWSHWRSAGAMPCSHLC